jgi:putative hydrolase of the HAD superfamily
MDSPAACPARYQAIIFDLFGTLADFPIRELDCVLETIVALLDAPPAAFQQIWPVIYAAHERGISATFSHALVELCAQLGLTVEPERLVAAAEAWRQFQARILVPRPDAETTLRTLRAHSYRIGVLGNSPADVPPLWQALPVAQLVDVAVFSCIVKLTKPDARIYHHLCQALDVRPEHCLFVGDGGSAELTGAARVGMHAVQLRDPHEDPTTGARLGREPWSGPSITTLSDVIPLVLPSCR